MRSSLIQVAKLGGSCFADISAMRRCAEKISQMHSPVIIVSAMRGHTDNLLARCDEAGIEDPFERSAVLASGEQVSAALFAGLLQQCGRNARSVQAWQIGIITEGDPLVAHPKQINRHKLMEMVSRGIIPVICGFQGVSGDRLTTFGRGGSDTSAIFVAAALGMSECILYKDVPGVYIADPRIISQKVIKTELSYAEMAEASSRGAKVLDVRAVDEARRHNIQIHIKHIFSDQEGTVIHEKKSSSESRVIAHVIDQQLVSIETSDIDGVSAWLSDIESTGVQPRVVAFQKKGSNFSWRIALQSKKEIKHFPQSVISHKVKSGLVGVSVVGWSVRDSSMSLMSILSNLQKNSIECHDFSLSDMSVTFWVDEINLEHVVQSLHAHFTSSDALQSA